MKAMLLRIAKWIGYISLSLIILIVLSLELFYHYKIHELKPQSIQSQQRFSVFAKEVLWVESGEIDDIGLNKLTATELLFRAIYYMATFDRRGTVQNSQIPSKGFNIASMVTRNIAFNQTTQASQGQIHINNLIRTVWLTRNTTANELIVHILGKAYFGEKSYGLAEAAMHFFGKADNELTKAETISLIALLKSPSRYHPQRSPRRFMARVDYVAERLKRNWPEKYGNYIFVAPEFSPALAK